MSRLKPASACVLEALNGRRPPAPAGYRHMHESDKKEFKGIHNRGKHQGQLGGPPHSLRHSDGIELPRGVQCVDLITRNHLYSRTKETRCRWSGQG